MDSRLERFCELTLRKRQLKAELDAVQTSLTALDAEIISDLLTPLGAKSLRTSLGTIAIKREIYASAGGEKERLVEALKGHGLDSYVTEGFNSSSISAYAREAIYRLEEENPDLPFDEVLALAFPDDLGEALKISEKFSLQLTAS